MKDKIEHILSHEFNIQYSDKLLVACSGGIDSMVLCSILYDLGYIFSIAHINYNLRGEDSILDKELVETFAEENQLTVYTHNVFLDDTLKESSKNLQAEARRIRYEFFDRVSEVKEIDFILTAHHLDDQLETLFFNLNRKMHLDNLSGIPKKRNNIIRPMLAISKMEIKQYASENQVLYREDKSNAENKYDRNKIRNTIIPAITDSFPEFREGFKQSIENFSSGLNFYKTAIENWKSKVCSPEVDGIKINFTELLKSPDPSYLLYLILAPMGFKMDIAKQVYTSAKKQATGATFEIKSHKILINRNEIICISNEPETELNQIIWTKYSPTIKFKLHIYRKEILDTWDKTIRLDKNEALFDAEKVKFPLQVRLIQEGDKIKPFGMQGKQKKVKKLLTDLKINRFEKSKIPVITDCENQIIWIPGFCHSNYAKIKGKTAKFLHLKTKKET